MAGHFSKTLARRLAAVAVMATLAGCSAPTVVGLTKAKILSLANLSANIMSGHDFSRQGNSDAADLDPALLGFAPVDRRAAEDFSLEIARKQNAGLAAPMLSFGMLSASFGSSYTYELSVKPGPDGARMAEATPERTGRIALTPGHGG